jgi:hypothetical protein
MSDQPHASLAVPSTHSNGSVCPRPRTAVDLVMRKLMPGTELLSSLYQVVYKTVLAALNVGYR